MDDDVDLEHKQMPDFVKNLRKVRIRRKGKEKRHGVAVVHRKRGVRRRRVAELLGRFRAAWGLSEGDFWGRRERESRGLSRGAWPR